MSEQSQTWAEMMPNGRTIYYEGDDPEGFCRAIKEEFGFDPRDLPGRNIFTDEPEHSWCNCPFCPHKFHCPPEHLDAIYDSGRWPMGS